MEIMYTHIKVTLEENAVGGETRDQRGYSCEWQKKGEMYGRKQTYLSPLSLPSF